MSRPGFLVYKCRRCGELVRDTHVPDTMLCVIAAVTDTRTEWGRVHLLQSHVCPDGGFGVTDLTGGEPCSPTCCKA